MHILANRLVGTSRSRYEEWTGQYKKLYKIIPDAYVIFPCRYVTNFKQIGFIHDDSVTTWVTNSVRIQSWVLARMK